MESAVQHQEVGSISHGQQQGQRPGGGKELVCWRDRDKAEVQVTGGHEGGGARVTLLGGRVSEPIVGAQSAQARAAVGLTRR